MFVNLRCSDSLRRVLEELIQARGLSISPDAGLILLEKGLDLPDRGIAVVFDASSLNELVEFLDTYSRKPDGSKPIIVGRQPDSEKYEIVPFDDILYFEAEGNYTYCVTAAHKLRVKGKLYALEIALLEQGFKRIGKSLMVNIMNVGEIIPWFGSRLLLKLKNNQEIEVSRNYVKEFKEFLEL